MISIKTVILALAASAIALPIRREVPQEHSHEAILTSVRASLALNNPDAISDPVFGLLGNAAAKAGQGKITDTDCLQQATADQAFTNAKAKKDVQGMTDALIFRALERNTGKVGLASVLCTAIKAKNPEIAALTQHQDPASAGAAATNKAITLELAKQIASIGGNPVDALKSGTFKPGDVNDNTGKGNTCDDANDKAGCIFSQNLIVNDATEAEVKAAAAGVSAGAAAADDSASDDTATATAAADDSAATTAAANDSQSTCAPPKTVTVTAAAATATAAADNAGTGAAATTAAAASATTAAAADAASGDNLQKFTGTLGGAPPAVVKGGRGFQTDGSDFLNIGAALGRSCDVQHNKCANAANSKSDAALTSVSQCDDQNSKCRALIGQ